MKPILIVVAVLLVVAVTTKSHFAGLGGTVDNALNAIPPVSIPSILDQSEDAGSELKLVLLALMPEGFDNTEMQLEAGEYLFIIGNRTGLKEVSIRLDRKGNERIAATVAGGRQRDWKKRLKLTAGTYFVTVNDNPKWTCQIVVGR